MSDKRMQVWLTRDTTAGKYYNFHFRCKPSRDSNFWSGCWHDWNRTVSDDVFHAMYPDVELYPGEGPIEVSMEIYEIRNGKVIRD